MIRNCMQLVEVWRRCTTYWCQPVHFARSALQTIDMQVASIWENPFCPLHQQFSNLHISVLEIKTDPAYKRVVCWYEMYETRTSTVYLPVRWQRCVLCNRQSWFLCGAAELLIQKQKPDMESKWRLHVCDQHTHSHNARLCLISRIARICHRRIEEIVLCFWNWPCLNVSQNRCDRTSQALRPPYRISRFLHRLEFLLC